MAERRKSRIGRVTFRPEQLDLDLQDILKDFYLPEDVSLVLNIPLVWDASLKKWKIASIGGATEETLNVVKDKLERLRTVLGDNLTTYTTTSNTYDIRAYLAVIEYHINMIKTRLSAPTDAETFTTTPLDANATYYSPVKDYFSSRLGHAGCIGFADQPSATDGVQAQLSIDGSNWDYVAAKTTASANVGVSLSAEARARYLRFVWTNGATAQTVFRFGGRYYI
ncbi:MAG: hypothetical protein QXX41_08345 [Nitrososphaerota archaeon]